MKMIAMPKSATRSFIRSITCAWMVTSSAVVGSSAIRSFGRVESAVAIIARWRMPPESSKAYCRKRLPASAMPTRSSISIERSRAAFFDMPRWSWSCSTIWSPMVMAGAKLAIGSWKIIETASPRTTRISRGVRRPNTSTGPFSSASVTRLPGA